MAGTTFIDPSIPRPPFVRFLTSGASKRNRDVRNGFEFDGFRGQTRRNNRPKLWAPDHDIRHCDFLILLCALKPAVPHPNRKDSAPASWYRGSSHGPPLRGCLGAWERCSQDNPLRPSIVPNGIGDRIGGLLAHGYRAISACSKFHPARAWRGFPKPLVGGRLPRTQGRRMTPFQHSGGCIA